MKTVKLQFLVVGCLALLAALSAPTVATAQTAVRSMSAQEALGRGNEPPVILVWPGSGTNISFVATGERITRIWLDDPSRVTMDFDEPLCSGGARGGGCPPSRTQVIHLRRIETLKFPNLPRTGSTLLTVITDGESGRKVYHFRVTYGAGSPEYSTVAIQPETRRMPLIEVSELRRARLEHVERGLEVAIEQELLGRSAMNQALYGRVRNFTALVRNGASISEAAQRSGVSMALVTRLAELGLNSAGSSGVPVR